MIISAEITQKMNCSFISVLLAKHTHMNARSPLLMCTFHNIFIAICLFVFLSFALYVTRRLSPNQWIAVAHRQALVCVMACADRNTNAQASRENEKNRNERQHELVEHYSICVRAVLECKEANIHIVRQSKQQRIPKCALKPNPIPRTIFRCQLNFQYCVSRCTLRTWVIRNFIYRERNAIASSRDLFLEFFLLPFSLSLCLSIARKFIEN